MEVEARLVFEYTSADVARDIAKIIQVDNEIAPRNLKIDTAAEKCNVVTNIQSDRCKTLFATIDDVLISEKLISEVLEI